jgi:hypothetical protein
MKTTIATRFASDQSASYRTRGFEMLFRENKQLCSQSLAVTWL